MYSGQDINSGLQPVMPQAPITSGNGPIILAPTEKKSKRWLAIIGVVLFLVAIGTGVAALILTTSKPKTTDATKAYIEYFVYGTEGKNQVNNATFEMDSDDFAIKRNLENFSYKKSSEYFDKLSSKYDVLYKAGKDKINDALLKSNGRYLGFYKAIMQTLNSDFLVYSYNNGVSVNDLYNNLDVDGNETLGEIYNALARYADSQYNFFTKVQEWNCMVDGVVDDNCIWGISEENDVSQEDSTIIDELNRYKKLLYGALTENLSKFYEQGVDDE